MAVPTPGSMPLDTAELDGLIPRHLRTRGQLDAWENDNVAAGLAWADRYGCDPLTEAFCRDLHYRMFGETWDWAGKFRNSNMNIGVDWHKIGIELREALESVRYWAKNHTFGPRETAARFHLRLAQVHPFPNGNGRHARAMADIICSRMGGAEIDWGPIGRAGSVRDEYLAAVRAADRGDFRPLIAFVGG